MIENVSKVNHHEGLKIRCTRLNRPKRKYYVYTQLNNVKG